MTMSYLTKHLFSAPFRPLFFFVGAGGVASIAIWSGVLFGALPWSFAIPPTFWHMHEMIYGLLGAAIGGFLLTAVPNWTSTQTISKAKIACVSLIWLLSRLLPWLISDPVDAYAQMVLQGLYWLSLVGFVAHPIYVTRNHRNVIFPVLLTLLMLSNMIAYWLATTGQANIATHVIKTSILMICLMTGIIGGRVIPFFIKRQIDFPVSTFSLLDTSILLFSSLGIAGYFLSIYELHFLPNPGWLMVLAGFLHSVRLMFWCKKRVLGYSLLWSLLIAYFCLGSGLIWLGYAHLVQQSPTSPFHFLAISSLSAMVVSIATRVSLGHTGRVMQAPPLFVLFFVAIVLAGIVRSIGFYFFPYSYALLISACLWCFGFFLFVLYFTPIYFSPRADGRV